MNETLFKTDYVDVVIFEDSDDSISICLYLEDSDVQHLGDMMNEKNPNAYMNGYNWEAFINAYLEYNAPEILEAIETDPEAGMYAAYIYDVDDDAKELAVKFGKIIQEIIENRDETLEFLDEYGDEIEWD